MRGRAVAWRPGPRHALAIARQRDVVAVDADTGRRLWRLDTAGAIALAWSADGKYVLALTPRGYELSLGTGSHLAGVDARVSAAAFAPRGHRLAEVRRTRAGSAVSVGGRVLFQGTGTFRDLTWSPDGRWLSFTWPEADQLVFVRATGKRRIEAVANVTAQFESSSIPRVAGWSG
jgi:Tol biopolymer transport system component